MTKSQFQNLVIGNLLGIGAWRLGIAMLAAFLVPNFLFAAGLVPCVGKEICNFCDIFRLVNNLFNFLALQITPALTVVLFTTGGLMLMFSGANENLRTRGKNIIRGTVIGLVIVLLSWVMVNSTINVVAGLGVDKDVAGQPKGFPWPWNDPSKFCIAP